MKLPLNPGQNSAWLVQFFPRGLLMQPQLSCPSRRANQSEPDSSAFILLQLICVYASILISGHFNFTHFQFFAAAKCCPWFKRYPTHPWIVIIRNASQDWKCGWKNFITLEGKNTSRPSCQNYQSKLLCHQFLLIHLCGSILHRENGTITNGVWGEREG